MAVYSNRFTDATFAEYEVQPLEGFDEEEPSHNDEMALMEIDGEACVGFCYARG